MFGRPFCSKLEAWTIHNDTTSTTVLNFITESAKWVAQLWNTKEVLYEVAIRGQYVV